MSPYHSYCNTKSENSVSIHILLLCVTTPVTEHTISSKCSDPSLVIPQGEVPIMFLSLSITVLGRQGCQLASGLETSCRAPVKVSLEASLEAAGALAGDQMK